ncbi:MAG: T9SS C-terminal target domain-containing protein [Saprospirales bacterium]|nr:MAG: T9SS C-terminal target domain-containing protein [Saprospirales bacterium]
MKTYTNLKITLTLILFMICSISGYMVGQTSTGSDEIRENEKATYFKYVSPNNTWTTVGFSIIDGKYSSFRYRFGPDSIAFEDQWYFYLQGSGTETGDNWSNIGLFREINGVVYGIENDEEHVFMDFNLEVGDQITIPMLSFDNSFDYNVLEVDSIELLDGSLRKRLLLECSEIEEISVYFVEGLGSLSSYLGFVACFFDLESKLLCFYQNGEIIYLDENYDECWITTSVTDIHSQGINIYPNPTTDFLTIEFDDAPVQEIAFKAYDYTGKLIRNFHHSGFQSHYRIEVSDFSPGFYYLSWELDGRPFVYHFVVAE